MSSVVPLKILDHYLLLTFEGDQQRERDSPAGRPAGPRSMFFNVSRSIPPTSVPCVCVSRGTGTEIQRSPNQSFTFNECHTVIPGQHFFLILEKICN